MATTYLNLHEFLETEVVDVQKINTNSTNIDNGVAALFKNASYNAANGVVTFTKVDNTVETIDLPLELLISDTSHYDAGTQELVLVLANMDEIRIPVSDLIDEYTADGVTLSLNGTIFSLKAAYKTKIDNTPLFVKLTQAEYDALVTKDENTIYCIKEV